MQRHMLMLHSFAAAIGHTQTADGVGLGAQA